jgi:hypothetical protein
MVSTGLSPERNYWRFAAPLQPAAHAQLRRAAICQQCCANSQYLGVQKDRRREQVSFLACPTALHMLPLFFVLLSHRLFLLSFFSQLRQCMNSACF